MKQYALTYTNEIEIQILAKDCLAIKTASSIGVFVRNINLLIITKPNNAIY